MSKGQSTASIRERLEQQRKIDPDTGCWLWTGYINTDGYGRIRYRGRRLHVHRLSLHVYKDFDLDSELQACHEPICKTRKCFNPDHLRPDTCWSNVRDSIEAGTFNGWGKK